MYQCLLQCTRPTNHPLLGGALNDLAHTWAELLAENALLRQQLIMLRRQLKRPTCTKTDRMFLLIKTIALNNRLWGAERIRGELLKLGIHVSKRTISRRRLVWRERYVVWVFTEVCAPHCL